MLLSMSNKVQKFIETISMVSGLDIEIVDSSLIRVAGTGRYNINFGKSIANAGNLVQRSIALNESLYVTNPRENPLCEGCLGKESCNELTAICTPIADESIVYGAIELACFDPAANKKLRRNADIYINFLKFIAASIAEICRGKQELLDVSELLDVMFQVLHTTGKACIIFSKKGKIIYYNDRVEKILEGFNISQIEKKHIFQTGIILGDMEEFCIEQKKNSIHLMGKHVALSSSVSKFYSIFVFDTLRTLLAPSLLSSMQAEITSLDTIIGNSEAIQRLKQQIIATSQSQSTVLILGESGTGKELIARAIHAVSQQADAPFVAINCGAIPDTLLESELFGYVGGAFTGASPKGQIGKFELAEGGVLFLDEISSMPIYLQAKLLRVLQEKTITRLGSNKSIKVNLRIISATNDDLYDMIQKNTFRQDLYYRLNVFPIHALPLRERMEDLDLLIAFFIEKYCSFFSKKNIILPESVQIKMKNHKWPGNVRELENCIEYLVNIADKDGFIDERNIHHAFLSITESEDFSQSEKQFVTLKELEQETIKRAVAHFGNSTQGKKEAAKVLGISLASLYRKLEDSQ